MDVRAPSLGDHCRRAHGTYKQNKSCVCKHTITNINGYTNQTLVMLKQSAAKSLLQMYVHDLGLVDMATKSTACTNNQG